TQAGEEKRHGHQESEGPDGVLAQPMRHRVEVRAQEMERHDGAEHDGEASDGERAAAARRNGHGLVASMIPRYAARHTMTCGAPWVHGFHAYAGIATASRTVEKRSRGSKKRGTAAPTTRMPSRSHAQRARTT